MESFVFIDDTHKIVLWIRVLLSACGWCCNRFVEAALIFEWAIVGGWCWLLTPVGRNWASGFGSQRPSWSNPNNPMQHRICGFRCNAYVLVVQLLQAMQCHITECALVCVYMSMATIRGSWVQCPRPNRASPRRGGARTTCMVVQLGHSYLHNTFNTYWSRAFTLSWCRELWSATIYLFSWLVSNIIRSLRYLLIN